MTRVFLFIACTFGLSAVALGAFGAHRLTPLLHPEQLHSWQTGVQYQFFHTFALFMAALLGRYLDRKKTRLAAWFFIAGVVFFSGSLYLLSTADVLGIPDFKGVLGPLTPLGGVLLMAGWAVLFWASNGYVKRRWYRKGEDSDYPVEKE
ncbi:MAG: membrane protein [Saprospiraceae bacterium]|nr:MAG: membrane protein [Saprospiraceae bacterium]